MAASIRIKISKALLDRNSLTIDPFWLLVLVENHPFISDVVKKIVSSCNDIITRGQVSQNGDSNKKSFDGKTGTGVEDDDHLPPVPVLDSSTSCQLWLDGCRLLDAERTDILRDNDSIVVKFSKHGFATRDDISLCDAATLLQRTNSYKEESKTFDKQNCSRKRKISRCVDDDHDGDFLSKDLSLEFVKESTDKAHKKKKKNKKQKETLSEKQKKRKIKDTCSESFVSPSVNKTESHHLKTDHTQTESTPVSNVNLDEEKRKLLCKLEGLVGSGNLSCNTTEMLENSLDVSLNDSVEKKKRRRRRKGKSRTTEDSQPEIKVEDKPRSSTLNLPWEKRPQNNKITFDSDDSVEDILESKERKQGVDDGEMKVKPNEDRQESEESIDNGSNDNVKKNAIVLEWDLSQKYKDLSRTSRKYLMRSTAGILDSLRSGPTSPVKKPVVEKSKDKSITKESSDKYCNLTVSGKPGTETNNHSVAKSTVVESVVNNAVNGTSVISTAGNVPITNSYHESAAQVSINNGTPSVSISTSSSLDADAKFAELLQRKKLSNTSCNVTKSQNGIAMFSRQKSPRWTPHQSEPFANPATDVLTNVSTFKKCNGNDGVHSEKVEVIPLEIEKCPHLSGNPCTGDILAYKIVEMNEDYTPVVSDFKTGKVLSCEDSSIVLKLFGNTAPKKQAGKFDLVYDEEEDTAEQPQTDEQVTVELVLMMDTRLVQRYN